MKDEEKPDNPIHNILEPYKVLVNVWFAKSKSWFST